MRDSALIALLTCTAAAACSRSGEEAAPKTQSEGSAQENEPWAEHQENKRVQDVVLAFNAHITVVKRAPDFSDYGSVERKARNMSPDVLAAQPFHVLEAEIDQKKPVVLKGVRPERAADVLGVERYMSEGAFELSQDQAPEAIPALVVGTKLAGDLEVEVGDRVMLRTRAQRAPPEATWNPPSADEPGEARPFRVVGIFDAEWHEYDQRLVFSELTATQNLADAGDNVSGIELRVRTPERAGDIAEALGAKLGDAYNVLDWCELNAALFGERCKALERGGE